MSKDKFISERKDLIRQYNSLKEKGLIEDYDIKDIKMIDGEVVADIWVIFKEPLKSVNIDDIFIG